MYTSGMYQQLAALVVELGTTHVPQCCQSRYLIVRPHQQCVRISLLGLERKPLWMYTSYYLIAKIGNTCRQHLGHPTFASKRSECTQWVLSYKPTLQINQEGNFPPQSERSELGGGGEPLPS
jgi:hypothetical protein